MIGGGGGFGAGDGTQNMDDPRGGGGAGLGGSIFFRAFFYCYFSRDDNFYEYRLWHRDELQ